MYYSDDVIEEVRSRNDIVDVISSSVVLKKKGDNYFGLCPFHQEKSGSFCVSRAKQMYHCFGCGAGGNVYTFLMEYEKMSFKESVVALANRVGISLPQEELSEEEKAERNIKERIFDINKDAANFFHHCLKAKGGEYARNYFDKRGLDSETIVHFGLGYSPIEGHALYNYLKGKGYDDFILEKSGLFIYNNKGVYDRFRDRVMFPIIDINKKVIGFGGRIMGDGEPKYLNSPESPVFNKGRNLYGLNYAKFSKEDNIIICEGYMDVIALHKAGFTQAVAALGTAFTGEHALLLRKYTKNIYMTFDSDGAGVKAAMRAMPIMRDAGLSVKSIDMRPYKDPDEFIKNLGREAFAERISKAMNGFMYKAEKISEKYDLSDPGAKTEFLREVALEIIQFSEEVERNNYIEAIAKGYGVDQEAYAKYVNKLGNEQETRLILESNKKEPKNEKKLEGVNKSQQLLLTMLCTEPQLYDVVKKYLRVEDFVGETYNKIAKKVFESIEAEGQIIPGKLMNIFEDEEAHKIISSLFSANVNEDISLKDKEKILKDVIYNIKNDSILYRSKKYNTMSREEQAKYVNDKAQLQKIRVVLK